MAIYRLLKTLPMGPEEIAVLAEAYEHTLRKLNLVERSDPITQLIAKKIIEIGQRGSAIRKNSPNSPSRSLGSNKVVPVGKFGNPSSVIRLDNLTGVWLFDYHCSIYTAR